MAGYARLREVPNPPELGDEPSIEIARIYAVTNNIGKGVGSTLMQQCLDIAREKKKSLVWLGYGSTTTALSLFIPNGDSRNSVNTYL
ncbi:GNAT family N-acetyltransferase [Paraflavitalea speifideaquila]|uniref:GNAT family N-acetyltransferase n=1 Tax=Paraflavitalea speifideaquila TaxID=3076558 RepID=UPI003312F97D